MSEMPPVTKNKTSDEYLTQLKNDLSKVENKNRELNSNKIVDENKLKEAKAKMVQELFAMMKEIGVDPNDLDSINKFLGQLSEQDPDLLVLFEAAFSNLVGGDLNELPSAPIKDPLLDVPVAGDSNMPAPALAPAPAPGGYTFQNLR